MKTMLKNRINIVLLIMSFLFAIVVFHEQTKSEIGIELSAENSASSSLFDSDLELNEQDFILNTFDFILVTYNFIASKSFYAMNKLDSTSLPIWQLPQLFKL